MRITNATLTVPKNDGRSWLERVGRELSAHLRAGRYPLRAAIARLGRPRAALALADGDPGQACLILAEAIEMAGTACGPFDQALLNDAMGMLLRRRGDRRRAADHLRSALERYDQLGAAPFRDRCAAELAACGLRDRKSVV